MCEQIVVKTSRGAVQGFDKDFGNDTSQLFYGYGQVFLGISFAVPPVGEKRFSLPEPLCRYNERGEVHNATYYRPRCTQSSFTPEPAREMSDDCLYLNVITPNVSGKYPVMVWIHGGTFTTGGADIYHWKGAIRNLVSRGIVVVTIQYRLGLSGFFTTFTERFPPNRGMYDQILALRWVNEEITNFGGDTSRITIYGQSAGAKAVSDLSLSPLTRGLFHQLIQSSGTDLVEVMDDPRGSIHQARAEQICGINSTDWGSAEKDHALLECFQRAKPRDLVKYDSTDRFNWNVAIDGAFLPDEPAILYKTRPRYPALIGDMLEDYSVFIKGVPFGLLSNLSDSTALDILRDKWPNYDEATLRNLTSTLIDSYSKGVRPAAGDHLGRAKLLSDIFTGLFFDDYAIRDVEWHRNIGNDNVWLFTFAHRSLLPFNREIDGWIPISHSSELPYVWFYPQNWETYNASKADFAVADYLGETWANFVKHGQISHPRVKESMNYAEFGESVTTKSNWRSISNRIYSEQTTKYGGVFSPLTTSERSWRKLKDLGSKVLSKWNSMSCPAVDTKSVKEATRSAPSTSRMAMLMLLLAQCMQMFLFIISSFLPLSCMCKLITVETSKGSVQGFDHDFGVRTSKTQRFFGYGQLFLGIPYAKAPLGARRFTLPEDIGQYNDRGEVHNATYYRPRCWQPQGKIQPADDMDEDCLYLNVMTPNISGNYPVMVYIHGGKFTSGGADVYHWKGALRNLVSRGVVVVTIQYRVGLIGFFTTFTERFPPNRGFYDKILALRWVNEEIANFGGDSNRITIFGQSSGAASVSDLSLSPLARGLFHQVIQTSGSSLVELETIEPNAGSINKDRARQVCQIDSSDWGTPSKDQVILDCFIKATPQELIAFDHTDNKIWNPSIDGAFLPDHPENLGKIRPKYPTMMVDMIEESAFLLPGIDDGDLSNVTRETALELMKPRFSYYDEETRKNMTEIMYAGYANGIFPSAEDHLGWAQLITQMFTGLTFASKMIRDLQWHRNTGNEDLWIFTLAQRSLLPFNTIAEGWIPVDHCYDLPYLWFYPSVWETYNASEADFAVADYMGEIYTKFAKNGELPYPRVGEAMNYVEITDLLTLKANWRSVANKVYNERFPAYLGQYPLFKISPESWIKLKETSRKVLSKWNSMINVKSGTKSIKLTTRSTPSTPRMAFLMLLLAQCLQVIKSMR